VRSPNQIAGGIFARLGATLASVQAQRATETSLGGGATRKTWANHVAFEGTLVPVSGNERYANDRVNAETKNKLITNYRADLLESDRLVINGRAYNITRLNNPATAGLALIIELDGGVAT
jgi:head-tail adaptor